MSRIFVNKFGARLHFGVLLATPLLLSSIASLAEASRPVPPASWLGIAQWVFLGIAAYMLAAPFVLEFALRRGEPNPKVNPAQLVLLAGVGGAPTVTVGAFMLTVFAGGPVSAVYIGAAISLMAALYWCWKYRELFR